MKRFSFRLDRVLEFRKNQRRAAEIQLEQMRHRLALLRRKETEIDAATLQTREERSLAPYSTGRELAASEDFLRTLASRRAELRATAARNQAAVEKVRLDLIDRDRQVKLLEKLRGRRLREHRLEEGREQQTEAGEHSLNRWRQRAPSG
jgi:flagellar export protein FliJ